MCRSLQPERSSAAFLGWYFAVKLLKGALSFIGCGGNLLVFNDSDLGWNCLGGATVLAQSLASAPAHQKPALN